MEVLIATKNKGKIEKYSTILKSLNIDYYTLDDINLDIGVQNLINPYEDDALNRRVEFIIIENSNDINIYNNYFRNN